MLSSIIDYTHWIGKGCSFMLYWLCREFPSRFNISFLIFTASKASMNIYVFSFSVFRKVKQKLARQTALNCWNGKFNFHSSLQSMLKIPQKRFFNYSNFSARFSLQLTWMCSAVASNLSLAIGLILLWGEMSLFSMPTRNAHFTRVLPDGSRSMSKLCSAVDSRWLREYERAFQQITGQFMGPLLHFFLRSRGPCRLMVNDNDTTYTHASAKKLY